MKKKGLIISVGRSDYDRYYPILEEFKKSKKIHAFLYLTDDHYDAKYGSTHEFVNKKFNIIKKNYKRSSKTKIQRFSEDLILIDSSIKKIKPDFIVVLGDRYEMLLGPLACVPKKIPLLHFYGGAITEGSSDELVRHAITKMSHLHFVAHDEYKKRLVQLGEESWRIKITGVLSLQEIKKLKFLNKSKLSKFYNFDLSKPYAMFTYHPTTHEAKNIEKKIILILNVLKKKKLNVVITYPNADPMSTKIINFFKSSTKDKRKYLIVKNCGFKNYMNLSKFSEFMIGNSSSGLVESGTLKIPSINIGIRQKGKILPKNVISCGYNKFDILKAIKNTKSKSFKKKLKQLKNPYEKNYKRSNMITTILQF